jgi:hypothetical protein
MSPRITTASFTGLLLVAACGGGGGDGGGGATTLTATGTIPVTATQFTSVSEARTCDLGGGVSFGLAFAAIGASDQPGMCGYLQQGQDKQNAKSITIVALKVNPLGPTVALTPGAYPVAESPGAQTEAAFVFVSQNDASCSSTDDAATSGTVTITSVDGGRINGTVNATLSGGGAVSGSFDAPSCAVTLPGDVCAFELSPPSGACVP